jgi:3-dehydroquinate synthase
MTWNTLSNRQIIDGLAETIKHACIADYSFFEYLEKNIEKILSLDKECCMHIARENVRIKYEVVMKDELESGLREVLNLGHTVGRAIETVSDYNLMHGEAVSIGLVAEVNLAYDLDLINENEKDRVITLLKKTGLPVSIPDYIDREKLVKKLYTDKKVKNGKLRFVLQDGIGSIKEFSENVYATEIEEDRARKIIMAM